MQFFMEVILLFTFFKNYISNYIYLGIPLNFLRTGEIILDLSQTEYKVEYDVDYTFSNILQTKDGLEFDIQHSNNTYHIFSHMIGEYMAENITACFAMAKNIGIKEKDIIKSIAKFQGIKRRLQKRKQQRRRKKKRLFPKEMKKLQLLLLKK